MNRLALSLATALLLLPAISSAAGGPPELWADFDPDAGDFREEIVHEETRDGIYRRDSYISAYVLGEEVRIYCRYAVKAGAQKAPGLMDIHGWMGAPGITQEYVDSGWAVLAHDYCGKSGNRPHYTRYPEALRRGNMDNAVGYRVKSKLPDGSFLTDPKQTDDYLWYALQRRALSYLLAQEEVDPDRIGAKGYSYGGTLMWNLGMDPRVKAVVAYFGIGWLEYYRTRGVYLYSVPPNRPEKTPGEALYLSAIAPQAHAPHITAASLWLNGTNDHHGGHERGEQTFGMFRESVPWSFAHQPRGHHDTRDIGQNTRLWLEKHVLGKDVSWPAQAGSKIVLDAGGVPELHISPADPDRVRELRAYYALKNPVSFGRAWRDAPATRQGNTWVAKMPVLDVDDYVFGFSNIRYDNTVVRSSPFTAAIPSGLGEAKATDKPSNQLSRGTGAWLNVGPVQGKDGVEGFRILNQRGAFNEQFSDPKWKGPQGARLAFRFYCTQPQDILLVAGRAHQAKVPITASDDWQTLTLGAEQFIDPNGHPLKDWSTMDRLQIKPAPNHDITKVVFADFSWEVPKPQAQKPPAGRRVYLTKKMATTAESFVKVVDNRAWQGTPIKVGGKTYQRGLGVHADSKLIFPLDGNYASFHVVPGPDDAHQGTVELVILVDEKEVFRSGPTSSRDKTPRKALDIPVTGARTLTLIVTQSDGNRGGDHASWADAYLLRPGEDPAPPPEPKPTASTHLPKAKLQPFLDQHCIACHGPDKQKAKVRFDTVRWEITNNDEAQRWQDVLDQLNSGDMPPEDEPQPTQAELAAALDTLTGSLLEARRRLTDTGGEIRMRRLNRREYSNTIRHLFGFDVPHEDIPEDPGTGAFDTIGSYQFFTSRHLEAYLDLGRKVATEALKWNTAPRRRVTLSRIDPEERANAKIRKNLAEVDEKVRLRAEGKSWKEMGFGDEGAMKAFFGNQRQIAELPRSYLGYPHIETGLYLTNITGTTTGAHIGRHVDIRGDYILRIRAGVIGDPDPMRRVVRIDGSHGPLGTLGIQGTPEKPEIVEFRSRQAMGRFGLSRKVTENVPSYVHANAGWFRRHIRKLDPEAELAAIWIDYLELEGPFYPEETPVFEKLLFPADSKNGRGSPMLSDERAADLIEQFCFEAFRHRHPDPAYLAALAAQFRDARAAGQEVKAALTEVLALVLTSPSFLYLQENAPGKDGGPRLDNRELAVRLAYFLWSAPPDATLYAADLSQPTILARQTQRMLDDPRAEAFRDGFVSQWAEFDRFDAITIDEKEHPRFNSGVRQEIGREVQEFFGALIAEDLPARNLIDSDFLTINSALAAHYGIEGVAPRDGSFQKLALPPDSPRGGLMTQAAFLITGSNGERSSPVIRGALVMEKLLRDKPAPPPPNVPELGSDDGVPRSNREMVKLHQEQAVCASCHKKMDVIGFGLENFDTLGRWRDTEPIGSGQAAIDPAGTLPDGTSFKDVRQLKTALLAQEEDLARELMESMFAYGLGRSIEFSDAPEIERLLGLIKDRGYPVRSMIREVALSPLFRRR